MDINKEDLRRRIISFLELQGFNVGSNLSFKGNEKATLRKLHNYKRIEQLRLHKNFLLRNFGKVRKYLVNGKDLNPSKIDLELREVNLRSIEAYLFLWYNLIWWSLPFCNPIARQMRFILWDKYHNAPFGLIGLQSPPLCSSVRDNYLKLNKENVDYWINQSMYAQRVGALPPYNELLGGKMVALSLTSNELRNAYLKKYENKVSLIKKREIPNRLLFISTTGAFGKSCIYERIKFKGENVSYFIGFTKGIGTFHISETLYNELLLFLEQNGVKVRRTFGTGPSKKLELIVTAFKQLGIPHFIAHNIKRAYYIFPLVSNLHNVIHNNEVPDWYNRPIQELTEFWKERWAIPRSQRCSKWKDFNAENFLREIRDFLRNDCGSGEICKCLNPGEWCELCEFRGRCYDER